MQIGYWSVPVTSADTNYTLSVDPYIPGAWPYLLQALNWAKQHNLHVILDLHGAPGSQNGYDNSGQRTNNVAWAADDTSVPRTLDIIKFIAEQIGGMIDILELINEPGGFIPAIQNALPGYYQDGYNVVRNAAGGGLKVMIMDGFLGVEVSSLFLCIPGREMALICNCHYRVGKAS
jgi:glucan 1,3-beta-glucosidase